MSLQASKDIQIKVKLRWMDMVEIHHTKYKRVITTWHHTFRFWNPVEEMGVSWCFQDLLHVTPQDATSQQFHVCLLMVDRFVTESLQVVSGPVFFG